MSFVIAGPEALTSAATDIAGVGSTLGAANAAAATPTTGIAAAAADEVSTALAGLYGVYAQEYQALSAQAAAFHARFVQALAAAAGWYTNAEAAAASQLESYRQQVLSFVNARLLGGAGAGQSGTGGGSQDPGGGSTGGDTTGGGTSGGGTGTGLSATYTVTSQWSNGFNADYKIANTGTTPVTNWQLQFNLPANESVTSAWSAQLAQSGTQYTLTPVSYNGTIAPGGSITVGFQATQTGTYSPPTNLLLNGQPVTGGTTGGGTTGGGTTGGGTTGGTVITQQYGTTTLGNYIVQNNAWNNGGNQAITVTQTGFTITTENGSAPTNGAPLGYPSIYTGWHYGTGSPGTNLPLQISDIHTATSSITYTYPTSGVYDASYDIWLNSTPITTGVNQQEVMIWFDHTGPIQPVGSVVGSATIDGKDFVVWQGSNGQNNVVSYVSTTPITTWTNFDVMGFINDADALEPAVNTSWYLTSIQAGYEPWSGSVGAGVDGFSATVT